MIQYTKPVPQQTLIISSPIRLELLLRDDLPFENVGEDVPFVFVYHIKVDVDNQRCHINQKHEELNESNCVSGVPELHVHQALDVLVLVEMVFLVKPRILLLFLMVYRIEFGHFI